MAKYRKPGEVSKKLLRHLVAKAQLFSISKEEMEIMKDLIFNAKDVILDNRSNYVIYTDSSIFEIPNSLGKYEYLRVNENTLSAYAIVFLHNKGNRSRHSIGVVKEYPDFKEMKEKLLWVFNPDYEDQLYQLELMKSDILPEIIKNHMILN